MNSHLGELSLGELSDTPGSGWSLSVAASLACALVLAFLSSPAQAAQHHGAAPAPAPVKISDGVVSAMIRSTTPLTTGQLSAAQPCVTILTALRRSNVASRICLRSPQRARVYQTGRHWFEVPVLLAKARARWFRLVARQGDLMLPAGRSIVSVPCVGVNSRTKQPCRSSNAAMTVPVARIRSCVARKPWLRYSGEPTVGKAVALTFDDGPGAITKGVLRILKAQRVPGTFFMVGEMLKQHPSYARRLLARGYVLGNHTWSHPTLVTDPTQISRTESLIWRKTGFAPCLFRAPYGTNPSSVVALARQQHLNTVNWNVDPRDWAGAPPPVVISTTLREVQPGSIAVFHDGTVRRTVLASLPTIIKRLKHRGYRFLTLPELLRLPTTYQP